MFCGVFCGVFCWGVLLRGFLWEWMGIGIMVRKEERRQCYIKNQTFTLPNTYIINIYLGEPRIGNLSNCTQPNGV